MKLVRSLVTRRVVRRIAQAVIVLWAAFTAAFLLLQALPGDAVMVKFLNPELGLRAEQIAEIRRLYASDSPLFVTYTRTLGRFLTGDFGYSMQAGIPVRTVLATNLPPTLWLAGCGLVTALLLASAIALGVHLMPGRGLRILDVLPSVFVSLPVFWLGIMLIQIVSFRLGLVPIINPGPWEALVLPTLTLAVPVSAPLAQVLGRNLDAVFAQPYAMVARAKGASHWRVLWTHALPNAMLPTVTIAGVLLGELLTGAVVTETVFGRSGLGSLTYEAVGQQDMAVLQAIVVIAATVFVLVNLVVDLLYPLLDPRLRILDGART